MSKKKVKAEVKMGLAEILALLALVAKYGIPAVSDAAAKLKELGGKNPTVAQIEAILTGVEPPEDF